MDGVANRACPFLEGALMKGMACYPPHNVSLTALSVIVWSYSHSPSNPFVSCLSPRVAMSTKRSRGEDEKVKERPSKRVRAEDRVETIESEAESDSSDGEEETKVLERGGKDKSDAPKRYILFIGNLPFTVTKELVEAHFECVGEGEVLSVRLLTKRDGSLKGCGFVDFASDASLRKALALHHTEVKGAEGRKINVELTVSCNSLPFTCDALPFHFGGRCLSYIATLTEIFHACRRVVAARETSV